MKFYLAGLFFVIIFSAVQFGLILRHKSPNLSDSYFYKDIYYRFQGESKTVAREKVISQIDPSSLDKVTKNIFENENVYDYVYVFFTRRPLYPFMAYLVNFVINNEYISFLIPVFISYLGLIIITAYFMKLKLGSLLSLFAISIFISFYPFLDWSTYFLTDTIGAFFWMMQLFSIYKFLTTSKIQWLYTFFALLLISLLNREQSGLMLLLLIMSIVFAKIYKPKELIKKNFIPIILVSLLANIAYILLSIAVKQRSILDAIIYTMNSYGFYNYTYTKSQILSYLLDAIATSHIIFARDLVSHHWWFAFSVFATLGVFIIFVTTKKPKLIDILMLSSAIASYFAIFIYPVLSYRFFYPIVIAVVYFAFVLIGKYGKLTKSHLTT